MPPETLLLLTSTRAFIKTNERYLHLNSMITSVFQRLFKMCLHLKYHFLNFYAIYYVEKCQLLLN